MSNFNYETIELKTKRLVLKKGTINDFIKVYEYDYKSLIGSNAPVKQESVEIMKCFSSGIDSYYNKCKKLHMYDWIIYFKNLPIGNILTNNEDKKNNSIEIIYKIHPDYWNNGYISELLPVVINYLFKSGYDNIVCTYSDGNNKVKRICGKLGFIPYRINKDSWKTESGDSIDDYEVILNKETWLSRTQKILIIK
ncbi:MAG: GNAT family N-acetyltransferase [Bacilli bacterium]